METLKNWAFSICCASVSGGIIKMLLPEGGSAKAFKTVFCIFFLCIVISPFSEPKINLSSHFDKKPIEEENFSENKFAENSAEYVKQNLISSVNEILSEENIPAQDIFINVNISENGSIDISKFTLILPDIKNISEIEQKIFQKTGIKPDITVLGDNQNG